MWVIIVITIPQTIPPKALHHWDDVLPCLPWSTLTPLWESCRESLLFLTAYNNINENSTRHSLWWSVISSWLGHHLRVYNPENAIYTLKPKSKRKLEQIQILNFRLCPDSTKRCGLTRTFSRCICSITFVCGNKNSVVEEILKVWRWADRDNHRHESWRTIPRGKEWVISLPGCNVIRFSDVVDLIRCIDLRMVIRLQLHWSSFFRISWRLRNLGKAVPNICFSWYDIYDRYEILYAADWLIGRCNR